MSTIRRQPPAHEQAMWPDALPASMVVPAGFTLYPPADFDLSSTDLTVRGTVTLPPTPPGAASETVAGLVELATQAEVDAGTDALRAVTPATLATRLTSSTFVFDDVTVADEAGPGPADVTITLTFSKDGEPVTQRVGTTIGVTLDDESLPDIVFDLSVSQGLVFFALPTEVDLFERDWYIVSDTNGECVIVIRTESLAVSTPALLWVLMPDGRVVSHAITLQGFAP